MGESTTRDRPSHEALAVVLQVRDGRAAGAPVAARAGAVPRRLVASRGLPRPGETLEDSIRRHLAAKVDVQELSHLEQLETRSEPDRHPDDWVVATAFLGLVPAHVDPGDPRGHGLASGGRAARRRLRPRLDRARRTGAPAGEALVHERRLRARAADLHDLGAAEPVPRGARSRRLGDQSPARPVRRRLLVPTGEQRVPGRAGGRPGGGVPLPQPDARGHGSVRRAAAAVRPVGRETRRYTPRGRVVCPVVPRDLEDSGPLSGVGHLVGRGGPARRPDR